MQKIHAPLQFLFVKNIHYITILCLVVFIICCNNFGRTIGLVNTSVVVFFVSILIHYLYTKFKNTPYPTFILLSYMGMFLCYFLMFYFDGESLKTFKREFSVRYSLILFPIAFWILPRYSQRMYMIVFITFITGIFGVTAKGIYNHWHNQHIETICEHCIHSGALEFILIPFFLGHHMLSIFNNISIILLLILMSDRFNLTLFFKFICGIFILVFIYFIHFIGARVGIISLYCMLITLGIYYSFRFKMAKYYFLIAFTLISTFAVLMYKFNARAKHRVDDTMAQISFSKWNINDYGSNFGSRIMALNVGIQILKDDFLLGCKYGDEEKVYKQYYNKMYGVPETAHPWGNTALKPHLEFVRMLAMMGLPIGVLFAIFYFVPFFSKHIYQYIYILLFFIPETIFCFTDMPFEMWYWYYNFSMMGPLLVHFYFSQKYESA